MKSPDGAPIGNTPNPSNGQVAVRIRNVSKTFPGQKALDDVGFDIQSGSIHALLGHNGSGKSTLIKILAGIYTPDAGALIEVGGHRLHSGSPRDSAKSGLRFVHQDLGLVDELTAAENMALTWGYPRRGGLGINWAVHSRNVVTALNRLNMSLDIDRPIGELRAVERTAVAIA
ncbi:MAG TPA: ATP-binding cassette domain-containing protein, partial [Microthrixaceae bacterium]|nr:ATP-binding cassette domain-containing protein [Microthrixaceae bacterium]